MSTIVYCDGVMAADTRAYSGSSAPIGQKHKIRRLRDGSLVGVTTSEPGLGERVMAWLEEGGDRSDGPPEDFNALHVLKSGEVYYYHDSLHPSGPLTGEYFAIGSGSEYALGALKVGASAYMAVRAAAELDPMTGYPLEYLLLDELEPLPLYEET